MTDDAIIIEALAMRLVEIRPGGEVWRVATRSRTGRVIPLPAAKRADPIDSSTGYRRVKLGKYGSAVAHRIVWIATHGPIAPGLEINHRNRDKADNRVDWTLYAFWLDGAYLRLPARLVPAAEADADPNQRGPLPKGG